MSVIVVNFIVKWIAANLFSSADYLSVKVRAVIVFVDLCSYFTAVARWVACLGFRGALYSITVDSSSCLLHRSDRYSHLCQRYSVFATASFGFGLVTIKSAITNFTRLSQGFKTDLSLASKSVIEPMVTEAKVIKPTVSLMVVGSDWFHMKLRCFVTDSLIDHLEISHYCFIIEYQFGLEKREYYLWRLKHFHHFGQ